MDININSKYIVIYIDQIIDSRYNIINNINNLINIGIIIFLLNNEEKKYINHKNILEIYPDNDTEERILNNSCFIVYISHFKRTYILNKIIENKNIIIFHDKDTLIDNIQLYLDDKYIINENNNTIFINYFNSLKTIIDTNIHKNIKININRKNNELNNNNKLHLVIFYRHFYKNNILNTIQKTCITQNIKNNDVIKTLIIGYNLKNRLNNIFPVHTLIKTDNKYVIYEINNIILCDLINSEKNKENIENNIEHQDFISNNINIDNIESNEENDDENISFDFLFEIINNIFDNKIICIVRSDIIIPNQEKIDYIDINIELSKKKIYLLPRLDRCIDSKIIKSQRLSNNLFSIEQDGWLFKAPLIFNKETYNLLENIYLYNNYDHLSLNNILIKNNYFVVNNAIFKILRIMSNNDIDKRYLLIEKDIKEYNIDDIYLIPETEIINKLSFEHLIKISGIDDNEIYKMKCYFFNKYLKNKIINNI